MPLDGQGSALGTSTASVAIEEARLLRRLSAQRHVVLFASNAYDHVYLRRNLNISAVPWPGLSTQLAPIAYTGGGKHARPEVLYCCGAQAYNQAIEQFATLIANASRMHARRQQAASSEGEATAPSIKFAWLNDLYPKSWHCKRVSVPSPPSSAPPLTASPVAERDHGAADQGGRRQPTGRRRSGGEGRQLKSRQPAPKKVKREVETRCGYRYEDVAAHPLVALLPYSVHSYGLVNTYAMGIPIVAPSLDLLSHLHHATGVMGHKGPGNVPWRATRDHPLKTWLSKDLSRLWYSPTPHPNAPCCAADPNDACTPESASQWLQFADWYQWPHIVYYDTPEQLVERIETLLRNATLRREISAAQKAFFARERERTEGHVRGALRRALDAHKVISRRLCGVCMEGTMEPPQTPRELRETIRITITSLAAAAVRPEERWAAAARWPLLAVVPLWWRRR